jgi:hypothetical protein
VASAAAKTLEHGLRVHRNAGRSVAVIRPPRWVKDVNELAQSAASECDEFVDGDQLKGPPLSNDSGIPFYSLALA